MTCNQAFFTLLLASRLFTAVYTSSTQANERSTDDSLDGGLEDTVTKVRLAIEESTPSFTYGPSPSYTYDPLPSYTYDPQPSYTYDPQPTYTYDPPAKRAEDDDVPVGIKEIR